MGMFGSTEKGTGLENSAKFQLPNPILSKDSHDLVICLQAVTTYDVIIF